jgi:hypothetical protein
MNFQCCVILTIKKEEILLYIHHLNYMLVFMIRGKPFTPNAIHLRITEFWTLPISLHSERTQFFRKWICFYHQMKEWGSTYSVASVRHSLYHSLDQI